jgi:hypothetical protein
MALLREPPSPIFKANNELRPKHKIVGTIGTPPVLRLVECFGVHYKIPEARTWWTLLGPGDKPPGHGIANAAPERAHHVFFRTDVGQDVDPLTAPANGTY